MGCRGSILQPYESPFYNLIKAEHCHSVTSINFAGEDGSDLVIM